MKGFWSLFKSKSKNKEEGLTKEALSFHEVDNALTIEEILRDVPGEHLRSQIEALTKAAKKFETEVTEVKAIRAEVVDGKHPKLNSMKLYGHSSKTTEINPRYFDMGEFLDNYILGLEIRLERIDILIKRTLTQLYD